MKPGPHRADPDVGIRVGPADAAKFRAAVLDFYRLEGRAFPWRDTSDPWAILVSEAMLQQTQTSRVVPKYEAWMRRFPDAASLASASASELYEFWKGLGYNSRALRLRDAARICAETYGGVPPPDERALRSLPGVGEYTARAVMAFAYGIPTVFLETNIRSALIYQFHPGERNVSDRELALEAEAVLDRSDPRTWYYALMDYGAFLKKREPNPSRRAETYRSQSRFEGSLRQVRGALLKTLGASGSLSLEVFAAESGADYGRVLEAAKGLSKDGLVTQLGDALRWRD